MRTIFNTENMNLISENTSAPSKVKPTNKVDVFLWKWVNSISENIINSFRAALFMIIWVLDFRKKCKMTPYFYSSAQNRFWFSDVFNGYRRRLVTFRIYPLWNLICKDHRSFFNMLITKFIRINKLKDSWLYKNFLRIVSNMILSW